MAEWLSEYGASDADDTTTHSQTPYFVSTTTDMGSSIGITDSGITAVATGGVCLSDVGIVGDIGSVAGSVEGQAIDFPVASTEFPVTLTGLRIRVGTTVPGLPGNLVVAAWARTDALNYFFPFQDQPQTSVVIPLASLPLVSAANNYGAFAEAVVPETEWSFNPPLSISQNPSYLYRAFYLDGVTPPVSGVVFGTLSFRSDLWTGPLRYVPRTITNNGMTLPRFYYWVENVAGFPSLVFGGGVRQNVRNVSYQLCFGIPASRLTGSSVQFIGG